MLFERRRRELKGKKRYRESFRDHNFRLWARVNDLPVCWSRLELDKVETGDRAIMLHVGGCQRGSSLKGGGCDQRVHDSESVREGMLLQESNGPPRCDFVWVNNEGDVLSDKGS